MNADILDGMRGVARFLSWFLLVPYFAVQLIPARPLFPGVSQEFYDRLRGQSIVAMIAMLVALPCIFPFFPHGQSRVSEYSSAAIAALAIWAVAVAWLKSLNEREYRAEFNLMATWKRCAFGLSTLMVIITVIAVEPGGRPSPKQLHLRCNDAATEMAADQCSPQRAGT
jgi:hypothetical protein